MYKRCSKCKESKPLESFTKRTGKQAGQPQSYCRVCEHLYRRNRMKQDPMKFKLAKLQGNLRNRYSANFTMDEVRSIGDPGGLCWLCGQQLDIVASELDHVIPISRGGVTRPENLRWAHRGCNRAKHDMDLMEFLSLIQTILDKHRGALPQ